MSYRSVGSHSIHSRTTRAAHEALQVCVCVVVSLCARYAYMFPPSGYHTHTERETQTYILHTHTHTSLGYKLCHTTHTASNPAVAQHHSVRIGPLRAACANRRCEDVYVFTHSHSHSHTVTHPFSHPHTHTLGANTNRTHHSPSVTVFAYR